MSEFVIYLLVRTDLKMRPGKIAAQCCHATEYLTLHTPRDVFNEYRRSGHPKIVAKVDSLEMLEDIRDECHKRRIQYHVVQDAGKTQVAAGSKTVLGVGPVRKSNVPQCIEELKLL